MKPLLAALMIASRIPGEDKTLKAAIWKWHEVLLQREDAECVRDGIVIELAVRSVGANVLFAVLLIKAGGQSVFCETSVAKISEHC